MGNAIDKSIAPIDPCPPTSRIQFQPFGLSQFPLIRIEGKKFSRTAFERDSHMENVKGPVASRQGIGSREPPRLSQHRCQIAGNHDQSTGFPVQLKGRQKAGNLGGWEKFAPACEAQGIFQFEFIEHGKSQGLTQLPDIGEGLGGIKIASVKRKQEASIATDRFHGLEASLAVGKKRLRLLSG